MFQEATNSSFRVIWEKILSYLELRLSGTALALACLTSWVQSPATPVYTHACACKANAFKALLLQKMTVLVYQISKTIFSSSKYLPSTMFGNGKNRKIRQISILQKSIMGIELEKQKRNIILLVTQEEHGKCQVKVHNR